jgi:hypothetical protein
MFTMTTTQLLLGYIGYYMQPSVFLYLLALFLRFKHYIIMEDNETMNMVLKKLKKDVVMTAVFSIQNRAIPGGYFIGWKCFGHIEHKYNEHQVVMYATPAFYEMLMQTQEVQHSVEKRPTDKKPAVKIDVFIRKGSYQNFYYNRLKLDLSHISPLGDQEGIVREIMGLYDRNNRATVFIEGVTNAGKSTIGYLLAKELRGSYCHTFNPTEPGDHISNVTMDNLYDDGPMVIVLEEVDQLLRKVHEGTVPLNPKTPTSVYNKSTWCSFLDDMIFYKNIIVVLTSNTSVETIRTLDPSYLRPGRVDAFFTMPNPLSH